MDVKAILVDDEQLALDFLERQLEKTEKIDIVGKYTNPLEAKHHIVNQEVDVVFLDIHLPEINGIELAEQILEEKPEQAIVFVTAYDEYAIKAFELNAIDYLLKPVQLERLQNTLHRIKNAHGSKLDYKESNSTLYIQVLGDFSIGSSRLNDDEVISWRTKKAEELFLYLLHHRGKLVRKSTLIDILWPGVEPERANSLLYTTIYYVRRTLRPYQNHIKVKNASDGYVLETKDVEIDLDKWEEEITVLPALNETTINRYVDIMSLYKGAYLQDYNFLWAEADQYRWEQLWLTPALKIANFYYLHKNFSKAKLWYIYISERHPEIEESHFMLMKIYAHEEHHALVHQQYHLLKKNLEEELGIMPSTESSKWYESWKKETM